MTLPPIEFRTIDELPPLPAKVTTKDGVPFDPRIDTWSIANAVVGVINFKFEEFTMLSEAIVHCLKHAMLHYLENFSFSHSYNIYSRFLHFYRSIFKRSADEIYVIQLPHITQYRAALDKTTEWYFGILRILLQKLDAIGMGIATTEVLQYCEDAKIPGNIKGTSVRTRDPIAGSFSEAELLGLQSALNSSYVKGEIDLYSFSITWLFLAFGVRPIQLALLKEIDLVGAGKGGSQFFVLRIPRAKQKGKNLRSSFKNRSCTRSIAALLELVKIENEKRRRRLGIANSHDGFPMFMDDAVGALPDLKHHMTSQAIANSMVMALGKIIDLKANSRRFRNTLAQRAVDDGVDKFTLAELLDHSDTQNVGVYFEAGPSIVTRLDRALALEMAPIAQAFAGVVVTDARDMKPGKVPDIYDRALPNGGRTALGKCGTLSFCGLAKPVACYACIHFRAWVDGPHEEYLDYLIDDRDRKIKANISPKIYMINDRIISAVAEVVRLCALASEVSNSPSAVV